ncbi:pre-mRNA 3'-end-processing factor FIP1 isoform X2 [Planococcus citri]|uniref:pre-mRNA 3'-end-processing factor FIP1 isoform X2 n=1 Tax=Planococcus citri TaxID=170843 RepID=UPI0031F9E9E6
MEEDNDDQWLYGEDSTAERPAGNDESTDKPEPDVFSEKEHEAFINPPESEEESAVDLEPPIIKAPGVSSFDEAAVVPGEEELMVPLNPPIINPPEKTLEPEPQDANQSTAVNGEEATENGEIVEKANDSKLSEGEDEDDDDDNINVVIGDIRTTPTNYNSSNLHIKRGNLLTLTKVYNRYKPNYCQQQQFQQTGKFAVDDFETVGVINGVPAHEFNLDNLEDKPWRKPGADITDYFNYGFNEETWRAYCERQKRMRVHESGSGLIPMNQQSGISLIPNVSVPPPNLVMPQMGMNSVDPNTGNINIIGGPRRPDSFAKENTIQVMTADRREYSKKNFTPDLSVPPPVVPPPYPNMPPGIPPPFPPMNQYGPPPGDYFAPEMDPYYHSYDHPQDTSWGGQPPWSGNIVPISNGSDVQGRGGVNGNPDIKPGIDVVPGVKIKTEPEEREAYDHDRAERSRDYDRERERESRHRERSHRHRSRSRSHERRSRKHKSRSRSPGYRSHKKKKSKKSERSKSDSD